MCFQGAERWADSEQLLTVSAGTIVIQHGDLFHRATRRNNPLEIMSATQYTAPAGYRPMLALRNFVRIVEPRAGMPAQWPAESSGGAAPITSTVMRYLLSQSGTPRVARTLRQLRDVVESYGDEELMIAAAYEIGQLVCGANGEALQALTEWLLLTRRGPVERRSVGWASRASARCRSWRASSPSRGFVWRRWLHQRRSMWTGGKRSSRVCDSRNSRMYDCAAAIAWRRDHRRPAHCGRDQGGDVPGRS